MGRIAVLDKDSCKPKDCGLPCIKYCPEVRNRIDAIKFDKVKNVIEVNEILCSGCGICIKKCPFKSLSIINLPSELDSECSHRYGLNSFKLFRIPIPKERTVTGLIGRNGIGKSTTLKILSGEIKPNLGHYIDPPEWDEIIRKYRGSILQNYFKDLSENRLKIILKPQYIDSIPSYLDEEVSKVIESIDERGISTEIKKSLDLEKIWERKTSVLSGGELQRVAIAAALCRQADVYIFDEPSSHLDVYQRLNVAKSIRSLIKLDKTIILAEHDLALLDYLSDQISILYGKPGTYGIVSHIHGVRVGINIYLDGYIPDENMRFRSNPIKFHMHERVGSEFNEDVSLEWGKIFKSYGKFSLDINPGKITKGEIVGILGPNGIGKTTFIRILAGFEKPDEGQVSMEGLTISYKPQYLSTRYQGKVESLLQEAALSLYEDESFRNKILLSLNLIDFLDRDIKNLSGGELQRVAIAECVFRDADVYFLDEPSAYLDIEERLGMAKLVRDIIKEKNAFGFIVEHDVIAQDFLADKLMIFIGKSGLKGVALPTSTLRNGMNKFLSNMNVTFRRDTETGRPRVNKNGSRMDKMQKSQGEYYYIAN